MGTVTVEGIATEFMRLIEEGWTPDIEEFLHHVPEDMRDDCRVRIEELTATAPQEVESAPVEEEVLAPVAHQSAMPVEAEIEEAVEVDLFAEPDVTGEVKEVVEAVDNPPEFEELEEVVEEPEPEPEPEKPVGMVKLSREEAKAMFAEMEAKAAATS